MVDLPDIAFLAVSDFEVHSSSEIEKTIMFQSSQRRIFIDVLPEA